MSREFQLRTLEINDESKFSNFFDSGHFSMDLFNGES